MIFYRAKPKLAKVCLCCGKKHKGKTLGVQLNVVKNGEERLIRKNESLICNS